MRLLDKIAAILQGTTPEGPDERELYPHLFPGKYTPRDTVGSIVFWALLKTAILVIVVWILTDYYSLRGQLWFSLFSIWLIAFWPAWRQYQRYANAQKLINENSLCAKCRHYNGSAIVCTLLDEHVSARHTPCEGESWEARPGV